MFPRRCLGCGREGSFLCVACFNLLPRFDNTMCPRCRRPGSHPGLCLDCTEYPIDVEGIGTPFRFEGVMKQVIYSFKYGNLRGLASPLAQLLAEYLATYRPPVDTLVAVPLHPRRLRERGYNQSALLATELSKLVSLPVAEDSLVRVRYTSAQAKTPTVQARRQNVTGAFSCSAKQLQGCSVLLIDDVCTSGATLNSCAAALKAAGAKSVWGLTLAREM